jgi:hypothetical protein
VTAERDEHLPREDQGPPEPAIWPVIVIGLAAGAVMLVARVAKFFP